MRYAVLSVILVACTGVHIDQVAVDDPTVNIDANAEVNATANLDATANLNTDVGVDLREPVAVTNANEQSAGEPTPVKVAELTAEPSEEEPAPAPDPCADTDSDGVCNDVDVCPAGADTDADDNGYADACEQELASDWIHLAAPKELWDRWIAERPGLAIFSSKIDAECHLEGVGQGFVGLPIEELGAHETTTVIRDRAKEGRAGKLAECLEAGVQLQTFGAIGDKFDGYSGTESYLGVLTAARPFPTLAGKHVTYFKVVADAYWTTPSKALTSWNTTTVQAFHAIVSVHGY